jgi:hypothetical protein
MIAGVPAEIRTEHLPTRNPSLTATVTCSAYPLNINRRAKTPGDGWKEGLRGCNHVSFRKTPDVSEGDIASILRAEE